MKLWPLFVITTILCWGAYVPTIHNGQKGFGGNGGALRAFIFVGFAYLLISLFALAWIAATKSEPMDFPVKGVAVSTLAGVLGALGALAIIFAMITGGKPIFVAPLVFAGAPIVNTIVSMVWHPPATPPRPMFYVGIVIAAVGAAIVLRYKPS